MGCILEKNSSPAVLRRKKGMSEHAGLDFSVIRWGVIFLKNSAYDYMRANYKVTNFHFLQVVFSSDALLSRLEVAVTCGILPAGRAV